MRGRTMVRWMVGIGYFPFFLGADLAAGFFAALFLAAGFASAFASALAGFAVFFLAGAASTSFDAFFAGRLAADSRLAPASSRSAIGVSVCPMAPASISTASDHRMWYVDTSWYGMTCTAGRLRPLRNTLGFAP